MQQQLRAIKQPNWSTRYVRTWAYFEHVGTIYSTKVVRPAGHQGNCRGNTEQKSSYKQASTRSIGKKAIAKGGLNTDDA